MNDVPLTGSVDAATPALFDADAIARDAIRSDLDATLFVEAGAGSGKTSSLVERVIALVTEADIPMSAIAAITFTEKAAAELRDRIRGALDRRARANDESAPKARAALDDLDEAAIGTLHGFAQRLLIEHPVEVGLPPRLTILDEVGSALAFDDRWEHTFDWLMSDPVLDEVVGLALGLGVQPRHLRELAHIADDNWDLVSERMCTAPGAPPPLDVSSLVASLRACSARIAECKSDDDLLALHIESLQQYADAIEAAVDTMDRISLLVDGHKIAGNRKGRKEHWPDVNDVRDQVDACAAQREALIAAVREPVLETIAFAIGQRCLESAAARTMAGELEFHDLLVLARSLLRHPEYGAEVRASLGRRYRRVLLDEFQDTDPIQIEIAVLLTSDQPSAGSQPWSAVVPEPGRLFVVGDPKQSIYRFRRADIKMFLDARRSLGARAVELSRNFRTTQPVIDWINAVFGELIVFSEGAQPEYRALSATRPAAPVGPSIAVLGAAAHEAALRAEDLRIREAEDVVAAITAALADGWSVWRGGRDDGDWEPARLGDIAILLPARTSLPFLEEQLEAAGIPYRAETSSLVYTTREVRELVMALRAIDDPTDELALVSTLRTSLYGCGDDDLFDYRVTHAGRWSVLAARPEGVGSDHPVIEALDHLRELHELRWWLAPSELLERLVRDRRVLEQGFAGPRPRELWRRVRFVIDQARAFADAGGGTLRDFLRWVEMQSAEGARVVESVLPETDDDAVRILTIHGAKGLEFPITILSGLTTVPGGRNSGVRLIFPDDSERFGVRFTKDLVSDEFERYAPIDEQMDFEERLRLLYVAATRARDHLIVSLHRTVKSESADRSRATYANLVRAAAEAADAQLPEIGRAGVDGPGEGSRSGPGAAPIVASIVAPIVAAPVEPAAPALPADVQTWQLEHTALLGAARVPRSWSATAVAKAGARDDGAHDLVPDAVDDAVHADLVADRDSGSDSDSEPATIRVAADPGLEKDARDLELPPWQRGRYGTAVGRAVHAVLQTLDLATGDGTDAAVAAQCAAEGIIGSESRVRALVSSARRASTVRAAVASGEYWRESYVATAIDGRVVEGYVDLIHRRPDGLVVVDYKTDHIDDPEQLRAKVAHYRLQGATYALAVARATGERVVEVVFVFCNESEPIEVSVEALDDAIAEVRRIVTST